MNAYSYSLLHDTATLWMTFVYRLPRIGQYHSAFLMVSHLWPPARPVEEQQEEEGEVW